MIINNHNINRATMKKNSKAKKIIKPPLTEETLRTFSKTDDVEQLKIVNSNLHRLKEVYVRAKEVQAKHSERGGKRISELTVGPERQEPPELPEVDHQRFYPGLN